MKKLILTAAAFALTAGVAFAEKPEADVLEFSKMQVSYRAGHNTPAVTDNAAAVNAPSQAVKTNSFGYDTSDRN